MTTLKLMLIIYLISFFICTPVIKFFYDNNGAFKKQLDGYPFNMLVIAPLVPLFNTYFIFLWVEGFILSGFNLNKMKKRINDDH